MSFTAEKRVCVQSVDIQAMLIVRTITVDAVSLGFIEVVSKKSFTQ